jgi:hypothetical protein
MKTRTALGAAALLLLIVILGCWGLFVVHAIREIDFEPPAPTALPCLCRASYGPCPCALGLGTKPLPRKHAHE